jgi:VIT1/CCC1 family predicted Fe2+/Mn2+ transporter
MHYKQNRGEDYMAKAKGDKRIDYDFIRATGMLFMIVGILYLVFYLTLKSSELAAPISIFVAGVVMFIIGAFKSRR